MAQMAFAGVAVMWHGFRNMEQSSLTLAEESKCRKKLYCQALIMGVPGLTQPPPPTQKRSWI